MKGEEPTRAIEPQFDFRAGDTAMAGVFRGCGQASHVRHIIGERLIAVGVR